METKVEVSETRISKQIQWTKATYTCSPVNLITKSARLFFKKGKKIPAKKKGKKIKLGLTIFVIFPRMANAPDFVSKKPHSQLEILPVDQHLLVTD